MCDSPPSMGSWALSWLGTTAALECRRSLEGGANRSSSYRISSPRTYGLFYPSFLAAWRSVSSAGPADLDYARRPGWARASTCDGTG
ncbi:hypothetical protein OH76DRAFT_544095 [Lentinus brumalis]|uniref:Secreted protein n=1 Tax=Lentinus brumalis TaxID=2498619 RepID=A0A371D9R9_9APHY|nr:hypothetical protein OH76DRAFT_544095 [Polyporus brumalis]